MAVTAINTGLHAFVAAHPNHGETFGRVVSMAVVDFLAAHPLT